MGKGKGAVIFVKSGKSESCTRLMVQSRWCAGSDFGCSLCGSVGRSVGWLVG